MKQYIASTEIADKQPSCNIRKQVVSSIIVMKTYILESGEVRVLDRIFDV